MSSTPPTNSTPPETGAIVTANQIQWPRLVIALAVCVALIVAAVAYEAMS